METATFIRSIARIIRKFRSPQYTHQATENITIIPPNHNPLAISSRIIIRWRNTWYPPTGPLTHRTQLIISRNNIIQNTQHPLSQSRIHNLPKPSALTFLQSHQSTESSIDTRQSIRQRDPTARRRPIRRTRHISQTRHRLSHTSKPRHILPGTRLPKPTNAHHNQPRIAHTHSLIAQSPTLHRTRREVFYNYIALSR